MRFPPQIVGIAAHTELAAWMRAGTLMAGIVHAGRTSALLSL
jgi:hypothetical protein